MIGNPNWKRWYRFLPYPRPKKLAIDEAIRLAKLEEQMAIDACFYSGATDWPGSGQVIETEKDTAEIKRLEKMKRDGLRFVTVFA